MSPTTWTIVAAIGEALGALVAGASAIIAAIAISRTVEISRKQRLLEQRQLLLPLWTHLQALKEIDPASPVWPDVITAVNTLELIAVCWEGQLIDEDIIRRMYSDLFVEFHDNIARCTNPPKGIAKDGPQLLRACPAVRRLYLQLDVERAERGKLDPIDK